MERYATIVKSIGKDRWTTEVWEIGKDEPPTFIKQSMASSVHKSMTDAFAIAQRFLDTCIW